MKKFALSAFAAVSMLAVSAQSPADKIKADRDAIMAMCGCYKVEFRYAEVYSPDTAYKFHDRDYTWAVEWVTPVENTDKKVVLQHLLVVDTGVVKHWRQDWLYENTSAHLFDKSYHWTFNQWKAKDVKGQWTQRVYQVDDSPRYTGTGTWIHADGKHFWESEASSPLPRREVSTAKRTDYNVLVRGNRHEITSYGWMHRQDNQKVLRQDGKDKLIAVETGYNSYTKIDNSKCELARKEWDKSQKYWALVRKAWDRKEAEGTDMTLKMMAGGQLMFERFFDLAERSATMEQAAIEKEINDILKAHVVTAGTGAETGYLNK
ncbi:MAG: DUF6607 family protein [Bacteroidota bacterium]